MNDHNAHRLAAQDAEQYKKQLELEAIKKDEPKRRTK